MNNAMKWLIASNVVLLLLLMGFAIGWKFLAIFMLSVLGLAIIGVPTGILAFLWKKYK